LQVFLAYTRLDRNRLLASMLAVAIFSAALAIMYFMHMAQERRRFFWSLIPATIFVLLMMNMIWSDSFRLLHMRPNFDATIWFKDSGDERQKNFAPRSAPRHGNRSPACSAVDCFGPRLRSVRHPGRAGREPLR
jgi:Prokaryotic Cytochrome C oxidase subunit IV